MTARTEPHASSSRTRPSVLTGLGIDHDSEPEVVESTTTSVVDYLASAPPELRAWADAQATQVREAAGALSVAAVLNPDEVAEQETPVTAGATATGETPRGRRISVPPAVLALILVPLLVWGVYQLDSHPDESANSATAASATASPEGPDPAQVKALEDRVDADPQDYEAMRELGKLSIASGDFRGAAKWQQQILADNPKDTDARLALGVALFNDGDLKGAEAQWTRVTTEEPKNPEGWYNLGFLYLGEKNPDMKKVERTWAKVVELDPDSNLAKTVESHLSQVGPDAKKSSK